jgi:hypothetical protein
MSRNLAEETAPTMIIPLGTRIEVDAQGQLSIHAPGNLVIQNSGSYGTIESLGGSVRIERGVEVEAVTVRCADTCFVLGTLIAWKVDARSLRLESSARAQVVLQETERLEVGRDARLVGNFRSEKELFGLFSRFAQQFRSLPFYLERRGAAGELAEGNEALDETLDQAPGASPVTPAPSNLSASQKTEPATGPASAPPPLGDLPDPLLFALVLLERELEARIHGPSSQRVLREIVKLLQEQDLETLRHTWRTLFGRIDDPRDDARRARELVEEHYTAAST